MSKYDFGSKYDLLFDKFTTWNQCCSFVTMINALKNAQMISEELNFISAKIHLLSVII